jgi:hypothetical protein
MDNGTGILWYGQPVPNAFRPVHQEGNIAVYRYSGADDDHAATIR